MVDQALPKNKILDIAEFGVPNMWQRTKVLQGFDPTVHTVKKFTEFCGKLKFAKGFNLNDKPMKTIPRRQVLTQTQVAIVWGY